MPRKISAAIAISLVLAMLVMGGSSYAASSPARVSLDLKNAELAEVFRVLATVGGANIVVSPLVQGKVTVKLADVPLEEALNIICSVSELEYVYMDGTIMVTPKGTLTKLMQQSVVEKVEVLNMSPSDAATKLSFAVPGLAVQPDDKTGTLLLRGSQADLLLAKSFLSKVDVPAPASKTVAAEEEVIDIIQLANAEAKGVYDAVSKLLKATLAVDTRLNAILAGGKVSDVKAARTVIEKLDVPKKVETVAVQPVEIRVLQLQNATAADVKSVASLILPADRVQSDAKSNSLIIKATPEEHTKVSELIKSIEAATPKAQAAVVVQEKLEVINLANAKAADVAKALEVVLPANKISMDERTNKVVILADAAKAAEAIALAKELDVKVAEPVTVVPVAPAMRMAFYSPSYAKASDIEAVAKLAAPDARIQVIESSNSLVAYATEAGHAVIEEAMKRLDQESAQEFKPVQVAPETLEIIQLKYASAAEVGMALKGVLPAEKVNVDARTNKVIMVVTQAELAKAKAVIEGLDVPVAGIAPPVVEPTQTGFYKIYNVKPSDIEPSVKIVAGSAKVTASDATSSITAFGTASELKVIENLIAKLDVKQDKVAEVAATAETLEVVQLMNASAADVKKALEVLMPDSKIATNDRTNKLMLVVTPELKAKALSVVAALDVPVAKEEVVKAEPVRLGFYQLKYASAKDMEAPVKLVASGSRVQVAERTNSLIVYGTESDLALVEQVIAKLDVQVASAEAPEADTEVRTYSLANASPTEVSRALTIIVPASSMMPDDRTGTLIIKATPEMHAMAAGVISTLDVKGTAVAVAEADAVVTRVYKLNYATPADLKAALSEVTTAKVSIDSRTSALIVTAPISEQEQIVDLIDELDLELAQVFFEASLYELSDDAAKRLGIDWSINKLVFGYNGLSQLATVSLDFDNTIAALAQDGKAKLISKQHTFTIDGKPGKMLIGDRIPVIVQEVSQGQVVSTVQYINAGIELTITPKVSYDGTVTANVKPIISSIVGWTPQNYPQIRTRELETIVTVRSGESAIIGGLFSQEEIETVNKLPILGDIPLLKELFTKRTTTTKDQEIIIVITAWTIKPGQTPGLKDGIVEIKGPVL